VGVAAGQMIRNIEMKCRTPYFREKNEESPHERKVTDIDHFWKTREGASAGGKRGRRPGLKKRRLARRSLTDHRNKHLDAKPRGCEEGGGRRNHYFFFRGPVHEQRPKKSEKPGYKRIKGKPSEKALGWQEEDI